MRIAPEMHVRLLAGGRIVRRIEELDEDTLKAIAEAEVPSRYVLLDEELDIDIEE